MLLFSLVLSICLLMAATAFARSDSRLPCVAGLCLLAMVLPPFCAFFSVAFGVHALMLIAVALGCALCQSSPRAFIVSMSRALDVFESSALAQLRTGEDMILGEGTNSYRALGALRALESCLQCHTVEIGHLLGAFSYHWWRATPAELPEDAPAI